MSTLRPPEVIIRKPIRNWQADLLLVLVTLVWGATFVVVQQAVAQLPPFLFLALRFDIAALLLLVYALPRLRRRVNWRDWAAGALVGLFLFAGYALQTYGLYLQVSAGKAAFITGLCVVLVPVLSTLWLRRKPSRGAWIGVIVATAGLGLLSLNSNLSVGLGDLLVLGCALSFALHITAVARYSGPHDPVLLTLVQIGVAALLSHGAALLGGERIPAGGISGQVWVALLLTGALATAAAFLLQNALQPFTSATHTALIFTLEPVFGALFGWLLAGEVLTRRGYIGAALILAGMVVAELPGRGGGLSAEQLAAPMPTPAPDHLPIQR